MNLRLLAERDMGAILEDSVSGFGWPIVLISPDGVRTPFVGTSTDIAQVIDIDTGQAISGRAASVALRMSSIKCRGLEIPQAISDTGRKPWAVEFADIGGECHRFRIIQSNPDRTLGLVTFVLEIYK